MNIEDQKQHINAFFKRQKEILTSKGNDYANEDRLSNFKLAGTICQLTPEQNCLSLMATKVARLGVLMNGQSPSNESIRDSIIDLANYCVLLDELIEDRY
jgi:hypothetical protein